MFFSTILPIVALWASTVKAYHTASVICENGVVMSERRHNYEPLRVCVSVPVRCTWSKTTVPLTLGNDAWAGLSTIYVKQLNCFDGGQAGMCYFVNGVYHCTDFCAPYQDVITINVEDSQGSYYLRGLGGNSQEDEGQDKGECPGEIVVTDDGTEVLVLNENCD